MKSKLFEAAPFIICEVGSNWTSFTDAKDSIQMAKQCGASAVKFQLFDCDSLYGKSFEAIDSRMIGHELTACAIENARLPIDWLPNLKEKADAAGIEFMCTAFSPELVKAVDPFVSVHKIASSDLTDPDMLQAVKDTGKPVILSCGASTPTDIKIAVHGHPQIPWKGFGDTDLVLLYCNSAYPSTRHNLFLMDELKTFGYQVGLSDHSLDVIYAPLSAVKHFGAIVIEKHFKLRDDMQTPDAEHSLNPDAFKCMVDYIRGTRESGLNPTSEEKDMFLRHNRRLIATKNLAAGDILKKGVNYGAFRSLEDDSMGLSPFFWEAIEGKALTVGVSAGKGLSGSMVANA